MSLSYYYVIAVTVGLILIAVDLSWIQYLTVTGTATTVPSM